MAVDCISRHTASFINKAHIPVNHLRSFLFITFAVFICLAGGCEKKAGVEATAERGILDLSGWDADRDGPIALDGQWEFYWDRLLTPEDFKGGGNVPKLTGYLNFPGFWKEYELDGRPLPGTGQGTFRLRILPGPENRTLVLRLFSIPAAYRMWADGKLIAAQGVPARDTDAETPIRSLVFTEFSSDGTSIDLVLQVSNHYFFRGGVQNPILMAEPGPLDQAHRQVWTWGLLFVGGMLIMALYHFILYLLRNKDISTLYFGLYCIILTAIFVSIDSSDWLIKLFFPNIEFSATSRIALISYVISTSVLYRFYRSLYPREFIRSLLYLADIRALLFTIIVMTQPGIVIYTALRWVGITALFFSLCFLVLLAICVRRKHPGALSLLCGLIILAATSLHDMNLLVLFKTNVVNLLPFGLFALVLSQAFALAQRFSKSFTSVEKLSGQLEAKNISLEDEITERSRLEREIVNISEEERRRMSLDLHDGICQQLTGARLRCAALSRVGQGNGKIQGLDKLSDLLDELVDQAYDLSCGIWPLEHGTESTGPSLGDMIQRYSRSSGIPIKFMNTRACETCRNIQMTQLYRIAQEAITNAIKHAAPEHITVSFDCTSDNTATLTVRDDGVGREAASDSKGGLGMSIMAHRAMMIGGSLEIVDIDESEGGGTMVVCSVVCDFGTRKAHSTD